jgi:urease accessory protein
MRVLTIFLIIYTLANAHQVGGTGFLSGFEHPVLGFDHFLAMVSVGIWSSQIGNRAIWFVPATFVTFMVLGGILGVYEVNIPLFEIGIAVSVFLLGIAIATERYISVRIGLVFISFFGIFHGYAHGVEMPNILNPFLFSLGFVLSTSMIHILGVFIGIFALKSEKSRVLLRYIGAGIAGIGLHIFTTFIPLILVMLKVSTTSP